MFCSKTANNLINSSHKRALRIILDDSSIPFEEALELTGAKYLHNRNLELLMFEVFKSLNSLNPSFMAEIFINKVTSYSFRTGGVLIPPKIDHNVQFTSLNSLELRAKLAWNKIPKPLKVCQNVITFKSGIKIAKIYCHCKICG